MNRFLEYCNHILLFLKRNILKKFALFIFERFQKISPKKLYLQYHPDSYSLAKKYPEFNLLFERFIQQNEKNNLGDINRLWSFIININQIIEERIEGDFAEVGVWRGNTAAVLAYYAVLGKRKVFLFDTFKGFDKRDLKGLDNTKPVEFSDTSVSFVKNVIGENSEACEFIEGYFPESLNNSHQLRYSIVSLDCDLYEPTKAGLDFFYPLLSRGGILLLHDYSGGYWNGCKKAIDEFCELHKEFVILLPDKSGSAFIRKTQ